MHPDLDFSGNLGSAAAFLFLRLHEEYRTWFPENPDTQFLERVVNPMLRDDSTDGNIVIESMLEFPLLHELLRELKSDDASIRTQIGWALSSCAFCAQAVHLHSDGNTERAWFAYAAASRMYGMLLGEKLSSATPIEAIAALKKANDVRHAPNRAKAEALEAWWETNKSKKMSKNLAAKKAAAALGMNPKTARNRLTKMK